ncbi:hypothetical protein GIB67_027389 [Kingdonia uniflora]|uniref:Uncharacterized protein n=1 Tax=Kingdonia uniflora TaxID=39325 RepID=A0A7J7MFD0_9MAGN|nr:hypothetical protein GIB67_027389 [Kingdonia uniflora]
MIEGLDFASSFGWEIAWLEAYSEPAVKAFKYGDIPWCLKAKWSRVKHIFITSKNQIVDKLETDMGIAAIKNVAHAWNRLIFSIKICYRTVRDHPFILAAVFLLIIFYRYLLFVLSYLVSSSPLFICTAILLRTFLNFGHPDIAQVEEERTRDISSLKSRIVNEDIIIEKRERLSAETRVEKIQDSSEEKTAISPSYNDGFIGQSTTSEGQQREIHGVSHTGKSIKDQSLEIRTKAIKNLEGKNDKRKADLIVPFGSPVDASPLTSRKPNVEILDFLSDHTESSSPDAPATEIAPVIDEHHPLLDSKRPQSVVKSAEEFDATSQGSYMSNDGSAESEDGENQEEARGDRRDKRKSAVAWTEDDEKNLMDLGTSELERNQRLENLIAKRRARKKPLIKETEKNLIDLDFNAPSLQITSISTTKNNPFDLPFHFSETEGLLPVPGSAPSAYHPRGNPFDIPYDPLEEKPNLTDDSFHEEFMTGFQKDIFFCRHESFSLGSSLFGGVKHEKRFNPYSGNETTSNIMYGFLSKSESALSLTDLQDNKKLNEDEIIQEHISPSPSEEIDMGEVLNLSGISEAYIKQDIVEEKCDGLNSSASSETNEKIMDENANDSQPRNFEDEFAEVSSNPSSEVYVKPDADEEKRNASSSSSSLEANEEIFNEATSKILSRNLQGSQPSLSIEIPDVQSGRELDDDTIEEPVYDSSPSAIEKRTIEEHILFVDKVVVHTNSSSIASDMEVEVSEVGSPRLLFERTISYSDADILFDDKRYRAESRASGCFDSSLPDIIETRVSGANQDFVDYTTPPVEAELEVEQVSTDSNTTEEGLMNQIPSSSVDKEINIELESLDQSESRALELSESSLPEVVETRASGANQYFNDSTTAPVEVELGVEHVSTDSSTTEEGLTNQIPSSSVNKEISIGLDQSASGALELSESSLTDGIELKSSGANQYFDDSTAAPVEAELAADQVSTDSSTTELAVEQVSTDSNTTEEGLMIQIASSSIDKEINIALDHSESRASELSESSLPDVIETRVLFDDFTAAPVETELVVEQVSIDLNTTEESMTSQIPSSSVDKERSIRAHQSNLEEINPIAHSPLTKMNSHNLMENLTIQISPASDHPQEFLELSVAEEPDIVFQFTNDTEAEQGRIIEPEIHLYFPDATETGVSATEVEKSGMTLKTNESVTEAQALDETNLEGEMPKLVQEENVEKPLLKENEVKSVKNMVTNPVESAEREPSNHVESEESKLSIKDHIVVETSEIS